MLVRSPFFGIGMILFVVHCQGGLLPSNTSLQIFNKYFEATWLFLNSSGTITWSKPGVLLLLKDLAAVSNSDNVKTPVFIARSFLAGSGSLEKLDLSLSEFKSSSK